MLKTERVSSHASSCLRLSPVQFFLIEGESECTSERARGQFSIFGAVEENGGWGFWRIATGQRRFENAFPRCLQGGVALVTEWHAGSCERAWWRIVHRGCTGNAERQWSVIRGSVASKCVEVPLASLAGQPKRLFLHELLSE